VRSVPDILNNDSHDIETADGVKYRLPFQNVKYRTTIKVVDYFPDRLEDFACLVHASEDGEPSEDEGDIGDSGQGREEKWEWQFALVVEDSRPVPKGTQKERLELYVYKKDAEYLLNLEAEE